jgi:hypothetical protein
MVPANIDYYIVSVVLSRCPPSGIELYVGVLHTVATASTNNTKVRFPNQANYINALAVSVLPFFESAGQTLGELFFSSWVNFSQHWVHFYKSGSC